MRFIASTTARRRDKSRHYERSKRRILSMRTLLTTALAALAVATSAGSAQAQPPADAKALLDQAITAKGGVAKLSELKAAVWTTRGVNSPSGARLQGQMPGQFRL